MCKAIIFDWAGVLAEDGFWTWLRVNIPDIDSRKQEFQKLSEKVDGGAIPHDDFMQSLSKKVGKSPDQVWQEVKKEIRVNHQLIDFISELKQRYTIALLSNFTYPWLNEIISENELWELFDHHIISSKHKLIKPNPEIFEKMLTMLQVNKNEAIFVDDRQYNVDAANALGIRSFLYTNLKTFKEDLRSVDIPLS